MKTNLRLVLTVTLFAGLAVRPAFADKQPGTNALGAVVAEAPAPAPAKPTKAKTSSHKTTAKKAVVKKAPATIPNISVPLKPGAATVSAKRVNVRGQATTRSEVLGRLTNSQPVTVIEEITSKTAKEDEPSVWAKIALPEGIHLWVSAQFVDATNKTVKVKKLNLRTGPGENYSVAGTLLKGDAVKDLRATNGWLEVEAPANSFAYVAAAYLKQQDATTPEPPAVAASTIIPPSPVTPVEPAPVMPTATNTVAENPVVAAPPTDTPVVPVPPVTNPDIGVVKPAPVAKPVESKEPPVPRIVEREGIVRRTFSIQAPSTFALVNPDTGKTVNYLYTNAKNLDLARYKGLRIIVTGEEGLDERWKNTPVITIQKIQVVE